MISWRHHLSSVTPVLPLYQQDRMPGYFELLVLTIWLTVECLLNGLEFIVSFETRAFSG